VRLVLFSKLYDYNNVLSAVVENTFEMTFIFQDVHLDAIVTEHRRTFRSKREIIIARNAKIDRADRRRH